MNVKVVNVYYLKKDRIGMNIYQKSLYVQKGSPLLLSLLRYLTLIFLWVNRKSLTVAPLLENFANSNEVAKSNTEGTLSLYKSITSSNSYS